MEGPTPLSGVSIDTKCLTKARTQSTTMTIGALVTIPELPMSYALRIEEEQWSNQRP